MKGFVWFLLAAASLQLSLFADAAERRPAKTAQECNEELSLNRTAIEAAGETPQAFFHRCWWDSQPGKPTPLKTARGSWDPGHQKVASDSPDGSKVSGSPPANGSKALPRNQSSSATQVATTPSLFGKRLEAPEPVEPPAPAAKSEPKHEMKQSAAPAASDYAKPDNAKAVPALPAPKAKVVASPPAAVSKPTAAKPAASNEVVSRPAAAPPTPAAQVKTETVINKTAPKVKTVPKPEPVKEAVAPKPVPKPEAAANEVAEPKHTLRDEGVRKAATPNPAKSANGKVEHPSSHLPAAKTTAIHDARPHGRPQHVARPRFFVERVPVVHRRDVAPTVLPVVRRAPRYAPPPPRAVFARAPAERVRPVGGVCVYAAPDVYGNSVCVPAGIP